MLSYAGQAGRVEAVGRGDRGRSRRRRAGLVLRLGLASADMGSLYRERIAPAARQLRHATHPPERAERYGVFVLAAADGPVDRGEAEGVAPARPGAGGSSASAGLMLVVGAGPAGESPRRLIERGRAALRGRAVRRGPGGVRAAAEAAAPEFGGPPVRCRRDALRPRPLSPRRSTAIARPASAGRRVDADQGRLRPGERLADGRTTPTLRSATTTPASPRPAVRPRSMRDPPRRRGQPRIRPEPAQGAGPRRPPSPSPGPTRRSRQGRAQAAPPGEGARRGPVTQ